MATLANKKMEYCISPTPQKANLVILLFVLSFYGSILFAEPNPTKNQGLFLVATEQLDNTSFQEAVILVTHFSARGATGLTINRPSGIPLTKVFPQIQNFRHGKKSLYLGGPVNTHAIFVLLRTNQPKPNMHHIAKNIFFSSAKNAFPNLPSNGSRTYAGYTGWAPKQLQTEIDRGDWTLVHTDPNIIFEEEPKKLWRHLRKHWSGQWL